MIEAVREARPGHVLILGGTREAAELAQCLAETGQAVTTSLAGRTREPAPVAGAVRVGGFGGATGLAKFLSDNRIAMLIDATHPFARQISANAVTATALVDVPLLVFDRPSWERTADDDWTEVDTLEQAAILLPAGARVLLALGSQHIAPFAQRSDVHFLIRMVDPPVAPLPFADHAIELGKPGPVDAETDLLVRHAITHIVCRNSGGSAAHAKIEAARRLSLPVIMIRR